MKTLKDYNFQGKKALVRVDYNVPLDDNQKITDTNRIDATIPTINKILEGGGAAILMSHLGRPKKGPEDKLSLRHLLDYLSKTFATDVKFADDCIGDEAKQMASKLEPGQILLLENLRFYKEEEAGDADFAKKLAELGDVYVNDAFGTAHREHASTAVIANFFPNDKLFGYLMEGEVSSLKKVIHDASRPFTAILGGAKVSSKIQVINHLIGKVDNLIIGGGMMFTFIKATGGKIGGSMVENELVHVAKNTLEGSKSFGANLLLPADAIAADAFANDAKRLECEANNIPDGYMGLDIGPASCRQFEEVIMNSKTILWNGPMGVFEMCNFQHGTKYIAEAIARATEKGAFSLVGGGDSVAAIKKFKMADKFSYVSTGGGAMLEYIEGKTLPGVAAIEND
ncbi:MAG TPA: phosphoglycerate kinase [Bacteroidales bacterium]|nr:phosphoglycerate kinase [Bacteroidales bacterium]